ncbi:MAG: S9 family peptidase [Acidobacteria bacterium]|nr:S9 family peptidase [Acidobacteriota bacterium]
MKKIFFLLALFAFCLPVLAQKYDIERYLNIRSAGSPSFSPDGKRIAFLTNITGTSQVWTMDAGGGYPEQITAYQDNVSFVKWLPDGKGLIFGKAVGGNENTQFFLLSNDGAEIKELTNNPNVRHNFGDLSKDGTRIFYTSNKRDRNWFDVYSMNLVEGKEELLYQDNSSNFVVAVSDDGSKVIVSRSSVRFSLDNDLYLIDAKTKKATHLTPHDKATQYGDVHFLPDGNSILFGTNQNGEFMALSRMDLQTKKIETLNNANWDLDAAEISRNGNAAAWTINKEGFSQLYVNDLTKREKRANLISQESLPQFEIIKLPASGVVGGIEFSNDGSKLAFTFSGAKYNADIWIYDLKTKKITQVTKSSRSGIPQSSFIAPQLIKFKTFDGKEIPAWYYKPQVDISFNDGKVNGKFSQSKNLPVIVSVHGGPEGQERPGFNPLYQYYLSRGYAILATNVRGSTGYGKTFSHLDDVEKREDSVRDLAAAVQWLKTQGGADPKRIAVMGGSYGGYMTMAAITLYPELFAAAVNTVGIVNWETFLKNTSGYRRRQREVEYGMLDKDIDFLRRISPIAKVDKIKTPLFVIHGKNDPRVPYTEAEQIVKVLRKRGATVEYKLFDDEGHGIAKLKNRLELYPLVADFLDKYMK